MSSNQMDQWTLEQIRFVQRNRRGCFILFLCNYPDLINSIRVYLSSMALCGYYIYSSEIIHFAASAICILQNVKLIIFPHFLS